MIKITNQRLRNAITKFDGFNYNTAFDKYLIYLNFSENYHDYMYNNGLYYYYYYMSLSLICDL